MRNLYLASASTSEFATKNNERVSNTAIDLDNDVFYVANEKTDLDGEVSVEIWSKDTRGDKFTLFTMFSSMAVPSAKSQVITLHVLPETRHLCAILACGDITMVSLDDECLVPDVEGTVEPGILSASWSPDDTFLVLVSSSNKLILMTNTFDVLEESDLGRGDFGEDAPINVGWGSKQTQFHGSLGKAAAVASAPSTGTFNPSPDDDGRPRISWRGDGSFFCVSSLSPTRRIRVYNRLGALQSTSETVGGLEHTLAWRPSGNLIASTQRFGKGLGEGREGRHDLVFFERNGLRHGEFGLDVNLKGSHYNVKDVQWSSDSNILSIWIGREGKADIVQLWTVGNYHWYLKHEITAPSGGQFTSVKWHPERALELLLTTSSSHIHRTYSYETVSSTNDLGCVAVLDGLSILLTSFRLQNIPPPMSSCKIDLDSVPVHMTFSSDERLGVLWENGRVEIYALNAKEPSGRGKVMSPEKVVSLDLGQADLRQMIFQGDEQIAVLGSGDIVLSVDIKEPDSKTNAQLPSRNGRLVSGEVWQSATGELFTVSTGQKRAESFPEFCHTTSASSAVIIGLSDSNKLFIAGEEKKVLAANVTSFTIASGFVIWTSTAHEATFALLSSLDDEEKWEKRRVERGSRIVVAVPSAMSLVLQMPRGNLETIYPRPMVMSVVEADMKASQFRRAFLSCRKHRIDMNVLVPRVLESVKKFVEQVEEVDHINLFLTSVGRGSHPQEVISQLCDGIREELERKDLTMYINSILTAHVVKTPPEYEKGLKVLLQLREGHPEKVEDALKYIIFLVDANKLFDTALGMYDFELVLMVAQHAQKDPREYLPFLRTLRSLPKFYQRFRIDDHLRRHESALQNISLAGDEHFDEAVDYVERHRLFESALKIWNGTERYKDVLAVYGDWLFERREWRQAAAVFVEANALNKAMVAYEKALDWQALFELAIRTEVEEEEVVAMGYRVAEDLSAKKRHSEGARVLLDYANDVREAVITLVQGNEFSEARRVTTLKRSPELVEEIIYPGALESRAQIAEDLMEMKEQLRKQHTRLKELRVKRVEEPDAFFGVEDTALHNVDVMTDVSMPATAFTRYTVAPSTATSKKSKQTSRSKRKAERKVGSGRKGTVDEEEYLFKSVTKLVARFVATKGETRRLLPHLFQFAPEHREEAGELQTEVEDFEKMLKEAVEWIWQKDEDHEDGKEPEDTWAMRMEQAEKGRRINPAEKVEKPNVNGMERDWGIKLLDLGG